MATAIDILKQIPQGIPTQVITTGAAETASISISVFGQTAGLKLDAKITDISAAVSSSLTTASNFTKTAHPGGVVDFTSTYFYVEETLNSVATRHIIYPGSMTYRNRNASELFDAAATLPALQAHTRDADVARSLVLSSYTSGSFSLYSGQPSRLTALASLSLLGPSSTTYSYNGNGAYVASNTGFAITMHPSGYTTHSLNFNTGPVYNAAGNGADFFYWYYTTYTGTAYQPFQCRMIGFGSYIFVFFGSNSGGTTLHSASAPISGFVANNTTNPGWTYRTSLVESTFGGTGTDFMQPGSIAELGGTVFLLMGSSSGNAANNQVLFKAVPNGSTGAVTGMAKVANNVDATFAPIRISGSLMYRYQNGTYFMVNSSGTVSSPSFTLARTQNMKTLATNYATAIQYKNSDGAVDTDGLFYYTTASTPYTTAGTFFCTKDGKYTLANDSSLNQLVLFDTNDTWFEKQLGMSVGDRVDYTQVTLGPNSALWVVANNTVQINVFGFKG